MFLTYSPRCFESYWVTSLPPAMIIPGPHQYLVQSVWLQLVNQEFKYLLGWFKYSCAVINPCLNHVRNTQGGGPIGHNRGGMGILEKKIQIQSIQILQLQHKDQLHFVFQGSL